jgi:GNAT superfamily N-acetyltransferase
MPEPIIRRISSDEAIAIRLPMLRDGYPRESAIFDGDDAPTTEHFGAFLDGKLVGVASLFRVPCPLHPNRVRAWQLRGMATLPEVRGLGFGKALLGTCEDSVCAKQDPLIWCNARVTAAEFYTQHGWQIASEIFEIPTVGPHYRMIREFASIEWAQRKD